MNFAVCDSGGTSSKWLIFNKKENIFNLSDLPLHPAVISFEKIRENFRRNILPQLQKYNVKKIYFYGAGFSEKEKQKKLQSVFEEYGICGEVYHDLLGAARSSLITQEGFVFIFGTGSNLGYYNGKIIVETFGGFGYLLGDEASGYDLSKKVLKRILLRKAPEEILVSFEKYFRKSPEQFLGEVYISEKPNKKLAELTRWFIPLQSRFIHENIVKPAFEDFQKNYFLPMQNKYPATKLLGFVGSIAWLYKEILQELFSGYSLHFIKNPLLKLADYHRNKQ